MANIDYMPTQVLVTSVSIPNKQASEPNPQRVAESCFLTLRFLKGEILDSQSPADLRISIFELPTRKKAAKLKNSSVLSGY